MRPEDRERIQVEVVARVLERHLERANRASDGYLQAVVNDTVYHELRRLERSGPNDINAPTERAFYERVMRQLPRASEAELRQTAETMARRFAAEIVGNFDERVYRLATTFLPTGLSFLLHAMSPRRLLSLETLRGSIAEHVKLQGATEQLKRLVERGTIVVTPTHSSHVDSLVLGYAVHLLGLPPLLYGAGLNLFTNPLTSFFMHNLGAYRVDRRKSAALYKEVLKEYATCATELGYHQLFFPGGTRTRSGAVEQHLKRGLLGTSVAAYVNNLRAGRPKPEVFIAPCTISYKLVLEAETLIDDYLKEMGKSRYIIEDDEFSKPRRLLNFLSGLISLEDEIVITFSEPLDVVGNKVDPDGHSRDPRGRVVDTRSYVLKDGEPVHDEQRDVEYTNELAEAIGASFRRDSVIMSTALVARALFDLLRRRNPGLDLYRLLHTGGDVPSFPMSEVHLETEQLLARLRGRTGGPRLGEMLARGDIQEIVADALTHFGIYHTHPPALRRGDRVFHEDRNLLLYYSNRLDGYALSAASGAGQEAA